MVVVGPEVVEPVTVVVEFEVADRLSSAQLLLALTSRRTTAANHLGTLIRITSAQEHDRLQR
jgi:hypothetical protein